MVDKFRFYDNTKVTAKKQCPRKYYLRHELGWTLSGKTPAPLVFGSSWHGGMDALWINYHKCTSDKQRIEAAMTGFYETWVEEGYSLDLSLDDLVALKPRTPGTADSMFSAYIQERRHVLENSRLIAAEQPFAVPLYATASTNWYAGKLDKVIEYEGRVLVVEHKTTTSYKKDGGFKYDFLDGFVINSQIDGYLYAGKMLYDNLSGVWVDAALVHDKERIFKFLPQDRATNSLDDWLEETRTWVYKIIEGYDALEEGKPLSVAFPRNTDQCVGKYSTCPFIHICSTITKVEDLNHQSPPPEGFKVEHWEPFDELGLDKIFSEGKPQTSP